MSKPVGIGERVGAIFCAKDGTVYFLGYGVFQGNKVPPLELNIKLFGSLLMDRPNPQILLDSGDLVFGCECWWGPEEQIKKRLSDYKQVIHVDIKKERAKYEEDENSD